MTPSARPRRNPRTASRTIDGEAVIVLPERMELRILSETGSRVWELIDGERTAEAIADTIVAEFEVGPEDARRDVLAFLGELESLKLITVEGN